MEISEFKPEEERENMLYRKLGKTGCDLSLLGFGCMRLPIIGGAKSATDVFDGSKPIDYEAGEQMVLKAIDSGVSL